MFGACRGMAGSRLISGTQRSGVYTTQWKRDIDSPQQYSVGLSDTTAVTSAKNDKEHEKEAS
jgi:hypothetical protein